MAVDAQPVEAPGATAAGSMFGPSSKPCSSATCLALGRGDRGAPIRGDSR